MKANSAHCRRHQATLVSNEATMLLLALTNPFRKGVCPLQIPKALEQLFASNYDMLLSIFNPEGWLDITYVVRTHRSGRDDMGHVYYLQRS